MCVLRAFGEHFDVDAFVKGTSLGPYEVCRRGERRFPGSKHSADTNEYSGVKIAVSNKGWDDLPGQIEDAVSFLAANFDSLRELVGFPDVEVVKLDFPIDLRIDGKTIVGQFDYLPPDLIRWAGRLGIGIEMSVYPTDESV